MRGKSLASKTSTLAKARATAKRMQDEDDPGPGIGGPRWPGAPEPGPGVPTYGKCYTCDETTTLSYRCSECGADTVKASGGVATSGSRT